MNDANSKVACPIRDRNALVLNHGHSSQLQADAYVSGKKKVHLDGMVWLFFISYVTLPIHLSFLMFKIRPNARNISPNQKKKIMRNLL